VYREGVGVHPAARPEEARPARDTRAA
jgi:hypothetical protein